MGIFPCKLHPAIGLPPWLWNPPAWSTESTGCSGVLSGKPCRRMTWMTMAFYRHRDVWVPGPRILQEDCGPTRLSRVAGLVAFFIFYFSIHWVSNRPNWLSDFEGLKPPTRFCMEDITHYNSIFYRLEAIKLSINGFFYSNKHGWDHLEASNNCSAAGWDIQGGHHRCFGFFLWSEKEGWHHTCCTMPMGNHH